MYKKLSDDQLNNLLRSGIDEFAQNGYEKASLKKIAEASGISVGVIYKYYADKEALFLACVKHCLTDLNDVLKDAASKSVDVSDSIKGVIHALIAHSKNHQNINRMYHEITSIRNEDLTASLAKEVEGLSSLVYTDLIRKAQSEGKCRTDIDAPLFAFFFDNLFMMIQFSYCCDYYQERLKLYCGEEIFGDDGKMEEELTKFMLGAVRK